MLQTHLVEIFPSLELCFVNKSRELNTWTHLGHKGPSRFQDVSRDVQSLRDKQGVRGTMWPDWQILKHKKPLHTHGQQELSLDVLVHVVEPGYYGDGTVE